MRGLDRAAIQPAGNGLDAGWAEGTKIEDVPSIKLQAQIPDAYAPLSLTIQPGQILLSDRFHLKTPAVSYDRKTCKAVDTQNIKCALQDIQVFMRPAPMELTKRFIDREQPRLDETGRQVLARIQPMKTEILGEAGMEDLTWGLPVSFETQGKMKRASAERLPLAVATTVDR